MSTLRISCFGILLKHYLLRHYATEVASKGRCRPEIEQALSAVPADFQIQTNIPKRNRDASMTEEYLQVLISLRSHDGPAEDPFLLSVQGILSRGRQDQMAHTLMPDRLHLAAPEGLQLCTYQIQKTLGLLALPEITAVVERESRIGIFQSIHQPALPIKARQLHEVVKLARVA